MIDHGLDYALYVIMGYFLLRGLFRGVVKEIVAVLGIFVAFWAASLYWPLGDEHLKAIFDQPGQRGVVSFILIFVVVYFLVGIISIFFDKVVKMAISPVVSSLFGAVVGVVKGILFCAVLLVVAETFLKSNDKFFTNSQWLPYLQPMTNQARAWMPEALQAAMTAKRRLPTALGGNGSARAAAGTPETSYTNLESVDWNTIQNLLATRPDDISPAWRDKLRDISSPEALSKEELRRFISEHPALFSLPAPAGSVGSKPAIADLPTIGGAAPSWPQPATE